MHSEKILAKFKRREITHLVISVILDLIGMVSYSIPLLAEVTDVAFAPFYGIAIFIMYRRRLVPGLAGGVVGTIEELLPATDVMPTATIWWIYYYIISRKKTLNQYLESRENDLQLIEDHS